MSVNNGHEIRTDFLKVANAITDGSSFCPPSEFTSAPVSNVAYAQDSVAGPSSTTISTLKITNTSSNATAKVHLDLTDFMLRLTSGKGVTVTDISIIYTQLTAVLTAAPALAAVSQTFGAASATAAAPTASATVGGTVTVTPASPTLTVPTAGRFYTVNFSFATPIALATALQRVYAEITFPMTATGVIHMAGAIVNYTDARY